MRTLLHSRIAVTGALVPLVAGLLMHALRGETTPREEAIPVNWTVTTVSNVVLSRQYSVRVWTTSDGLPMNRIQCLLQTRDGFLWVGTQGGLARFDGRKFALFNSANTQAFRQDSCLSLAEGSDGTLWIGTVDGIVSFRSNRFEHIAVRGSHPDFRRVNGLSVTASGTVWAATGQGPGFIKNDTFFAETNFVGYVDPNWKAPTKYVVAIEEDSAGNLLLADLGGVQRWEENRWQRISGRVGSKLVKTTDGAVWVVGGPLSRITEDGIHQEPHFSGFRNAVGAVATGRGGRTWAAAGKVVYAVEGALKPLRTQRELPGEVEVLLVDREGGIWAGTTSGLACLSRNVFAALTTTDGLVYDDVWSISEAPDGAIWIGTSGGVSQLEADSLRNFTPRGQAGHFHPVIGTQMVLALRNGEVWVTPAGLLCRIHPLPPFFARGNDGRGILARPYFEDSDGSILIEHTGLSRWKDGQLEHVIHPRFGVSSVLRDNTGRLWVGTRGDGVYMIDGGLTNRITTTNGLTSDFSAPALAEENGTIWIASDKGLNRWKDGRITAYTIDDGLPEGFVLSVVEDRYGWFWLNGHRGIHRVPKQQLNDFAEGRAARFFVVSYGELDGLPSAEGNGGWIPNSCQTKDVKLWFPTTKGVAVVDPSEIRGDPPPPTPLITDIIVDGEKIYGDAIGISELTSEISLPAGRGGSLQIRYVAPSFTPSSRFKLMRKLENQDAAWVEDTGEGSALYTNLRPGRYSFWVRALNTEGASAESPALTFAVAPHFYQTWPFYLVCGIVIAGLAGAVHMRRLSVQHQLLQLEQQNALERERSRIAADIHDALGADFSRIAILSERLPIDHNPEKTAKTISETVRRMGGSMSELIWATNSRNDSLDNLISYIRERAAEICDSAGIKLFSDVSPLPSVPVSGFLRHNVYLIVRESLNNILKHSRASEVRFRASLNDRVLELEISDNGWGFAPNITRPGSRGQVNLRKRAADIHAEIAITSDPGSGTTVALRVPLRPPFGERTLISQEISVPPQSSI